MDGIVYGTAAALGFASVENIFYVLNALEESQAEATELLIWRAMLSVPGHALWAVPWAWLNSCATATPEGAR